jgi:hypothetical protein
MDFQKHPYPSSNGLLCGQHYIQLIVLLSGESRRYQPSALASVEAAAFPASLLAPLIQALLALMLATQPTFASNQHIPEPSPARPLPRA